MERSSVSCTVVNKDMETSEDRTLRSTTVDTCRGYPFRQGTCSAPLADTKRDSVCEPPLAVERA